MCDENSRYEAFTRDCMRGFYENSAEVLADPTILLGFERIESDEDPAFTEEEHFLLGEWPTEISSFYFYHGRTFVSYFVWQQYQLAGVPEIKIPSSIMSDLFSAMAPSRGGSSVVDHEGLVFYGRRQWIEEHRRTTEMYYDKHLNPLWAGVRLNAQQNGYHLLIVQ